MDEKRQAALIAIDTITSRILLARGQKAILDMDLAALYGITTRRLNEQIRRNLEQIPSDFVFQLTVQEVTFLRSQIATSSQALQSRAWGGRRYLPYAFTEHGAIMAAMVLNSARAIEVSVYVVRAFVQQRDVLLASKEWVSGAWKRNCLRPRMFLLFLF